MPTSFNTLHVVKVKNTGDEILSIMYLGQVLQIPPGETRTVPWDAACGQFGNPLVANAPNRPERNDVYNATRALWGFAIGYDVETEEQHRKQPPARQEMASSWEARMPHYEVYTIDTDERILMVLDDPDGSRANPGLTGVASAEPDFSAAESNQKVADLQKTVAGLSALVEKLLARETVAADDTVDEDTTTDDALLEELTRPDANDNSTTGSVQIPKPVAINPADTPTPKRK